MSVSPAIRDLLIAQIKSYTPDQARTLKEAQEIILRSDAACQRVQRHAARAGKGKGVTFEAIRRAAQGNLDLIAQYRPEI